MGNFSSNAVGHGSSPGTAARNRIYGVSDEGEEAAPGSVLAGMGCMPSDEGRVDGSGAHWDRMLLTTPRCGTCCANNQAEGGNTIQGESGQGARRGIVIGGGILLPCLL